jgi:hypothetical protein
MPPRATTAVYAESTAQTNASLEGGGHRGHVCRDCRKLPKAQPSRVETLAEMWGFVTNQSSISKKNRHHLQEF